MSKILSRSGAALADIYDVEGSIAGIDNLDSREVHLTHEMGAEIHSERLQSFIIVISSGAINQSSNWNVTATFPDSINRVLGIYVSTDVAARISHCNVALVSDNTGVVNGFPLWAWDGVATVPDVEYLTRLTRSGTVGNHLALAPRPALYPFQQIITRDSTGTMPLLAFTGLTPAFGAGTITATALILVARPDANQPGPGAGASHGLPIPSW